MRLLANENVSATVIQSLRQRGHDVLSAKESMRGESDSAVLLRARQEGRLVVTHDKDFGELAFRNCLPAECGILLFRLGGAEPADPSYTLYNKDAYRSDDVLPNSGRVRVTVSPQKVRVEYVRSYLPKDATPEHPDGAVALAYEIAAPRPAAEK